MLSAFKSAALAQMHFRLDFIMEANTKNPDQTAPLGLYVLQFLLPKNISR